MWFIGVEVEQETSASPPKKNPGSAPDLLSSPSGEANFREPKLGFLLVLGRPRNVSSPLDYVWLHGKRQVFPFLKVWVLIQKVERRLCTAISLIERHKFLKWENAFWLEEL